MLVCSAALLAIGVAEPTCNANGKYYQNSLIVFTCDGSGGTYETNLVKVMVTERQTQLLVSIPKGVTNFKALLRGQGDADLQLVDPETRVVVAKDKLQNQGGDSYSGEYLNQTINFISSEGVPTMETVELAKQTPKVLQLLLKSRAKNALYELGFQYDPWTDSSSCPMKENAFDCAAYDQLKVQRRALTFASDLRKKYSSAGQAWSQGFVPYTTQEAYVPYWNWPFAYEQQLSTTDDDPWAMYKFVTNGGFEADVHNVRMEQIEWIYRLPAIDLFANACCKKMRTMYADPEDAWKKLQAKDRSRGPGSAFWRLCEGMTVGELYGATFPTRTDFFNYFSAVSSRRISSDDFKFCYQDGPVLVTRPPVTTTPAPLPADKAMPAPASTPKPTPAPPQPLPAVLPPVRPAQPTPSPTPEPAPKPTPEPAPLPTPPAPTPAPPAVPSSTSIPGTQTFKPSVATKTNWKAVGAGVGAAAVLAGAATGIGIGVAKHWNKTKHASCPTDTQKCPDGSYVVRDPGNQCNFAPCANAPLSARKSTAEDPPALSAREATAPTPSQVENSESKRSSSADSSSFGSSSTDVGFLLVPVVVLCCVGIVAAIIGCLFWRKNVKKRSALGMERDAYDDSVMVATRNVEENTALIQSGMVQPPIDFYSRESAQMPILGYPGQLSRGYLPPQAGSESYPPPQVGFANYARSSVEREPVSSVKAY